MVEIVIPYNGKFDSSFTNGIELKNDIVWLNDTTVVTYSQQSSQAIGFIGVYTFNNFVTSQNTNRITQQVFFQDNIVAAKLYKLAANRVALVRDKNLYIYEITGNTITEVFSQTNFFTTGLSQAIIDNPANSFYTFYGLSLVDNELLIIENTRTNIEYQDGVDGEGEPIILTRDFNIRTDFPVLKLRKLAYNTGTQTVSIIDVTEFSTASLTSPRGVFVPYSHIIPGTTTRYLGLAIYDRGNTLPANGSEQFYGNIHLTYLATINTDGTEITNYTLPSTAFSQPGISSDEWKTNAVVMLSTSRIVFINSQVGKVVTWNGNSFNFAYGDRLYNTGAYLEVNKIYDIVPLDVTHYGVLYNNLLSVRKYVSDKIFKVKERDFTPQLSNYIAQSRPAINTIDDETIRIIGKNSLTPVFGKSAISYNMYRLYQPND